MTTRAHVAYDWLRMSLELTVVRDRPEHAPAVLRLLPGGPAWEPFDEGATAEPTLVLPPDASEAVLEAFRRHLATASGYVPTEARSDYLAERARVDRFIGALIGRPPTRRSWVDPSP